MKKVLILIILIIIVIILIVGWLVWKGYQAKEGKGIVVSYKTEYTNGENPKIKIRNDSGEEICFSSCYPYYLEKNNGGFKSYNYGSCPEPDIAEICLKSGEIKAFELMISEMGTEKGLHRIAVPACIGCVLQERFRSDRWFYSNEFTIK